MSVGRGPPAGAYGEAGALARPRDCGRERLARRSRTLCEPSGGPVHNTYIRRGFADCYVSFASIPQRWQSVFYDSATAARTAGNPRAWYDNCLQPLLLLHTASASSPLTSILLRRPSSREDLPALPRGASAEGSPAGASRRRVRTPPRSRMHALGAAGPFPWTEEGRAPIYAGPREGVLLRPWEPRTLGRVQFWQRPAQSSRISPGGVLHVVC